jgi:hypothetical protein
LVCLYFEILIDLIKMGPYLTVPRKEKESVDGENKIVSLL